MKYKENENQMRTNPLPKLGEGIYTPKRASHVGLIDENLFTYDSNLNFVDDSPNPPPQPPTYSYEFCRNDAPYGHDCPPQVSFIYNPKPCYNQDFNFPQNIQRAQGLSHHGDEHLDTIPEKESDEFIKSSVENLVPNPSEFEDLSNIGSECDVPVCDDFMTFFNLLFDVDDNFSSSDDESFYDEDVPKEIYLNPLFDEEIISIKIDPHYFNAESDLIESLLNQDSSIISSFKIDSLLDEFASGLIFLKSIPPGIDQADCDPEEEIRLIEKLLYDNSSPRPPEELNSKNSDAIIESFSPSPIPVEDSDSLMKEIDLSLTLDDSMPSGIENDDYDSEEDILFLEELLSNDSPSLPENESFHFDIPSSPRPPAKPPDDDEIKPDMGVLTTKMVGDISEHYVLMPRLLPTQPTLCLVIDTLLLFSSENEDKVHLLSHRVFKLSSFFSESPMMIMEGTVLPWMFRFSISILLDQLKIAPDFEDSCLWFCPLITRSSHPQLHFGIQYPNLID
nr:hypothetical protein [Tanacetum cinerariifolium]